jgi:2-aminoethylphosphonate-pyruvate transaminase
MNGIGLKPFLRPSVQSVIIVTFHAPVHPAYNFKALYQGVRDRGFILYPGKLTQVETFRVGCIGALAPKDMNQVVQAVAVTLRDMGVPVLT